MYLYYRFAPFNGAYTEHIQQMKKANLPPKSNLWFGVYDFNDEMKTQKNWSIIHQSDEEQLWCPLGPAENCCPRIETGTIPLPSQSTNNDNQSISREFQVQSNLQITSSNICKDYGNEKKTIEKKHENEKHTNLKRNDFHQDDKSYLSNKWEFVKQKTIFIYGFVIGYISDLWNFTCSELKKVLNFR